jgi:Zn-dependent metalloprotease
VDARGRPDEHVNATILSHAYYEFVKRIGHHKAGRVLHNVPATLSPFPTFFEVARGFVGRAGEIYPQDGPDAGTRSDAREAAEQAFDLVGIHITDHRGERPG